LEDTASDNCYIYRIGAYIEIYITPVGVKDRGSTLFGGQGWRDFPRVGYVSAPQCRGGWLGGLFLINRGWFLSPRVWASWRSRGPGPGPRPAGAKKKGAWVRRPVKSMNGLFKNKKARNLNAGGPRRPGSGPYRAARPGPVQRHVVVYNITLKLPWQLISWMVHQIVSANSCVSSSSQLKSPFSLACSSDYYPQGAILGAMRGGGEWKLIRRAFGIGSSRQYKVRITRAELACTSSHLLYMRGGGGEAGPGHPDRSGCRRVRAGKGEGKGRLPGRRPVGGLTSGPGGVGAGGGGPAGGPGGPESRSPKSPGRNPGHRGGGHWG